MKWKEPKKSSLYRWTIHAVEKMKYYGLSEMRVKSVIKKPLRIEENFLEDVVLAMQPQSVKRDKKTNKKIWSSEIWVMYKYVDIKQQMNINIPEKFENLFQKQKSILVISSWKYPGITNNNGVIPIEIENEIYESENLSDNL